MEGLRREWGLRLPQMLNKQVVSIYFGGGTPALLGAERIGEILAWCAPLCGDDIEITLEANPEFIDRELMSAYRAVGINRVSIGVQSLDDTLLKRLTREHDAQSACNAVETTVSAGINNISIDLMYDVPGQTVSSWQETLDRAVQLPITHLSLYNLTIEPHTGFFKKKGDIEKELPDETASLEMYRSAVATLNGAGLQQYEISAFAKERYQSRHNVGYWTARPFLGFGPSAFSYWSGARFRNIANLNRYSNLLLDGATPIDFDEKLDDEARRRELLAINIRLLEGVDIKEFQARHGPLGSEIIAILERLISEGFVKEREETFSLTEKGILFYDSVATELI